MNIMEPPLERRPRPDASVVDDPPTISLPACAAMQ
jgi:hypothetical protein